MKAMHGGHLWRTHEGVRSGDQLSVGERAADHLKAAFGSWTFLIILNVLIVAWITANIVLPHASRWDVYPFILLNLGLSWLAAQQGGALQIAANRGDRINAEVALHTQGNTDTLMGMNERQLAILQRMDGLDGKIADLAAAVQVVMAARSGDGRLAAAVEKNTGAVRELHGLVTSQAPAPQAVPAAKASPAGSAGTSRKGAK